VSVAVTVRGESSSVQARREGGHVVGMQRRRLLLAFTELVAEGGLDAAGVGRVCQRAGVSRRTFYDLFEDRDSCLLAAFELAIERLANRVVPAYAGETRWVERVRAGLRVLLECLDAEPSLARLCVIETPKGGPRVLQCRHGILGVLLRVVDRGRNDRVRNDRARNGKPPSGVRTPGPLTAESVVGGAIAVIHARLIEPDHRPLLELLNPLMSMIVHPYLGTTAARRELDHPTPSAHITRSVPPPPEARDPFKDLQIRITFRTARVLSTIAELGANGSYPSNRDIGHAAGVPDQGQMSRLLRRLQQAGLIDNHTQGQPKGEANAWQLTPRGHNILTAVSDTTHNT
jgi:AcrR family transcriptional regulator